MNIRQSLLAATLGCLAASTSVFAVTPDADPAQTDMRGVILPPAPWLDPNAPAPSQPEVRSKAVASVGAIDTMSMAAVTSAYSTYYNVAMPPASSTGSIAGCNAGSISLAFQEWTITRINFLRAMAGVPGNTTLDATKNAQQQAAALIMSANNTLNHAPPSTYMCWTQAGSDGAGSSNLAMGSTDSLPIYMSEPGAGNQAAGHRRWILHSRKNSFGMGQVTDGPNSNALYVFQSGAAVSTPNGIPWPPRGYVPLSIFPTSFTSVQRWSFGFPNANFGAASVAVTLGGVPLVVNVVSRVDNGYGDNTLVWEMPANHTVAAGTTYTVTITGITGAPSTTYTYQIFPFNPAATPADLSITQSASPSPAQTGKDIVYTLTVANGGSSASSSVTVTNPIPAATNFIWASPECTSAVGTVTCALGTLAGGASRQLRIVLRRSSPAAGLVNTATVSGSPDANAANNTSTATVAVTASPAGVATTRYRLYSPITLEHHFTTDLNEYNALGALAGTWVQEGAAGKVLNNPGSFNGVAAVPYYRLYCDSTRWHHWTTDANEYYALSNSYPCWHGEGVDGYILPSTAAGTTELYRLVYMNGTGLHHWTVDENEVHVLTTTLGWAEEPGAGFVIQ